jgi:hypothetical protein
MLGNYRLPQRLVAYQEGIDFTALVRLRHIVAGKSDNKSSFERSDNKWEDIIQTGPIRYFV